jgi:hypothetical protein
MVFAKDNSEVNLAKHFRPGLHVGSLFANTVNLIMCAGLFLFFRASLPKMFRHSFIDGLYISGAVLSSIIFI